MANKVFERSIYHRTDVLFSVRVNGVDVAAGITRAEAETYLQQRRVTGGSCMVYRTDRPLEDRKAIWSKARLPRMPSMRVSDAERAKLLASLAADGTLAYEAVTVSMACELHA